MVYKAIDEVPKKHYFKQNIKEHEASTFIRSTKIKNKTKTLITVHKQPYMHPNFVFP